VIDSHHHGVLSSGDGIVAGTVTIDGDGIEVPR
jgi:hypothetical protein